MLINTSRAVKTVITTLANNLGEQLLIKILTAYYIR